LDWLFDTGLVQKLGNGTTCSSKAQKGVFKKSFAINPFAPFFNNQKDHFQSSLDFFVWSQEDSSTAFLFTFFFSFFSSFLTPTRFGPVESDPFHH